MDMDSTWCKVVDISFKEDDVSVKAVQKPVPVVLPDTQNIKSIQKNDIPSRIFTINPVDITMQSISDPKLFVSRRIVDLGVTRKASHVLVCALCGRIMKGDSLCKTCFPHGLCSECYGPLSLSGNCDTCCPYGRCHICGTPFLVEGVCGNNFCRNQGPVLRCSACHKPLRMDGICINGSCIKSKIHSFTCSTASCKMYCRGAIVLDEDESSGGALDTRQAACKLWGVHEKTDIAKEAVNFYTAWGLSTLYNCEEATDMLNKQVSFLTTEFTAYFDLAVGGELRHCMRHNSQYREKIPKWLQSEFPCDKARPCAWLKWYDIRKEYGLAALAAAVSCFKLPGWPGSYGGNAWASIAYTLLEYLEGKHSALVFLDQAFSLEHNCGCAFNKIYHVGSVTDVLNVCFETKDPLDLVKSRIKHLIHPRLIELAGLYGKV